MSAEYTQFAEYAQANSRFLTPPVCERFESRWQEVWEHIASQSIPNGEISDPATGTVLARLYTMDAFVDNNQQTVPDIRKRIPQLPQSEYPGLVVLVKRPPGDTSETLDTQVDVGSRNGLAVLKGTDGQDHLWGITPQGQIGRPWIGDSQLERSIIVAIQAMVEFRPAYHPVPQLARARRIA